MNVVSTYGGKRMDPKDSMEEFDDLVNGQVDGDEEPEEGQDEEQDEQDSTDED
jgi:hypothetical protein